MGDPVTVRVEDKAVLALLDRIQGRLTNMGPFYKNVGEYMVPATRKRFDTQTDPSGRPWKKLKPETLARKKTNTILRESSQMADTVFYEVGPNSVSIVSAKVQSAIHQLGGKTKAHIIRPKGAKALFWLGAKHPVKSVKHPGSNIPARPFLGVSAEDGREIEKIGGDFLLKE